MAAVQIFDILTILCSFLLWRAWKNFSSYFRKLKLAKKNKFHSVLDICFQVALVVFLAHIGSFVPADSAVVGLTDRFVFV